MSYGDQIPADMQARMKCGSCGVTGCKMWREYQTFASHTKILCGTCALRDQGKVGPIDADGYRASTYGRTDQIGWLVPAVPTHDGTFWGYTSVPDDGVAWWRELPTDAEPPVASATAGEG